MNTLKYCYRAWALLGMILWMGGCAERDDFLNNDLYREVSFTAKQNVPHKVTSTRVVDNLWEPGDAIGVYVQNEGKTPGEDDFFLFSNSQYRASVRSMQESALFRHATENYSEKIALPDNDDSYTFKAYYPYYSAAKAYNNILNINLENQAYPTNGYLMIAKMSGVTYDNVQVPMELNFKYQLSKIKIKLTPGEGFTYYELTNADVRVELDDMYTQGTYNLVTDELLLSGDPKKIDFKYFHDSDPAKCYFRCITFPKSTIEGIDVIRVYYKGKLFGKIKLKSTSTTSLEKGTLYEYNITMSKSGLSLDSNIVWEIGHEEDVDASIDDLHVVYRYIPGGKFYMGSSESSPLSSELQHLVELSPYYLGAYEITVEQYCKFLNSLTGLEITGSYPFSIYYDLSYIDSSWGKKLLVNANYFSSISNHAYLIYDPLTQRFYPADGAANKPINHVTWYGVKAFANFIGADLPTEAQWENGIRGDYLNRESNRETPMYYTGDDITTADANWESGSIAPVGTYPPNNYGLYNMAGNMMEFVNDWYADNYGFEGGFPLVANDPLGPTTGSYKVIRGADFRSIKAFARSSYRSHVSPDSEWSICGFRVAKRVN